MTKIKSIVLAFFVAVSSVASIAYAAEDSNPVDISVTTNEVNPGEAFSVTISLPADTEANGIEVSIAFPDDKLTVGDVTEGNIIENSYISSVKQDTGLVRAVAVYEDTITGGGNLISVQFTAKDNIDSIGNIDISGRCTYNDLSHILYSETIEMRVPVSDGMDEDENVDSSNNDTSSGSGSSSSSGSGSSSGSSSGSGSGSGSSSVSTPTAEPTAAPEATDVPSTATPSPMQTPSVSFSDINGHWAEESIKRLSVQGLVNGFEDGTFHPDDTVTRAQFVKMIISALGNDMEEVVEQTFSDVSTEAWYAPYVEMAYKYGIIAGDGVYFYPDNNITRQEMAVMTARAFGIESGSDITFNDGDSIADWAVESVKAISGAGIMGGYEDNTFRPEDNTTRAQAAAVIDRILN